MRKFRVISVSIKDTSKYEKGTFLPVSPGLVISVPVAGLLLSADVRLLVVSFTDSDHEPSIGRGRSPLFQAFKYRINNVSYAYFVRITNACGRTLLVITMCGLPVVCI